MSIGIVLSKPQDVRLVHWAARIARSRYQSLVIFWLLPRPNKSQSKRSSSRDHEAVPPELEETCNELQTDFIILKSLPSKQPCADPIGYIGHSETILLILGKFRFPDPGIRTRLPPVRKRDPILFRQLSSVGRATDL